MLVKQATTLDVLSGGRATFGVGAAWFEREHIGLGVPFPPVKGRMQRLEEMVQIALHVWRGDRIHFSAATTSSGAVELAAAALPELRRRADST